MTLLTAMPLPDWESEFASQTTTESGMPYLTFTGQLEQSPNDQSQYRLLRLPNNMTVVCISDKDAQKSAAGLSVGVGSFSDPKEAPGLAHLLEHMFYIHIEAQNEGASFKQFVKTNSGYANAFTAPTSTSYVFDISNSAFKQALEIFSAMFSKPVLDMDACVHEINAVNSEFNGLLSNAPTTFHWLSSHLMDPSHPYARYHPGNSKSLGSIEPARLQQMLQSFFNQYYSADIMKLVIYGKQNLDELTEMAVSMFSKLISKESTSLTPASHPLSSQILGKLVRYKSIENRRNLYMQFALPDASAYYRIKPLIYISNHVNQKGAGSLIYFLHDQGLADNVSTGYISKNFDNACVFTIHVDMTQKGAENYHTVVQLVFGYLQMMKENGAQEWFHKEMVMSHKLRFENFEKPSPYSLVSDIASSAHDIYLQPRHIVTRAALIDSYDASLIEHFLELLNPSNYRMFVGTQDNLIAENIATNELSGIEYYIEDLSSKLTTDLETNNPMASVFSLPKPNAFMPSDFTLVNPKADCKVQHGSSIPALLKKTDLIELWYRGDDKFFLPKGVLSLKIEIPYANTSPINYTMVGLLVTCWGRILSESLHQVGMAGLNYTLSVSEYGIHIKNFGYSHKLPLLLDSILSQLNGAVIEETTFQKCMEMTKAAFARKSLSKSYLQAKEWAHSLMSCQIWDTAALEDSLNDITFDKLQQFARGIFDKVYLKMLVSGNFHKQQALDMADKSESTLGAKALPLSQRTQVRSVKFESGSYALHKTLVNEKVTQGTVHSRHYLGKREDVKLRVLAQLIAKIIREPFFDCMRTKEQLGYAVFASACTVGHLNTYLLLTVQGSCNPLFVSQKITQFLCEFRQTLLDLDEQEVGRQIELLIERKQSKLETISAEASRMWLQINAEYYEFDKLANDVECLQKLGKADLLEAWDEYINPNNTTDSTRVEVCMWPAQLPQPSYKDFSKYPTSIIALHHCLADAGAAEISLERLYTQVESVNANEPAAVSALFKSLMKPKDDFHLENEITSKSDLSRERVRMALDMAVAKQGSSNGFQAQDSASSPVIQSGRTTIITDIACFHRTQQLNGRPATRSVHAFIKDEHVSQENA